MKKKSKFLLGMSIASCLCLSLGTLSACGGEEAVIPPEADNQIQTIYNAYAAQAGENALSYEAWLETIKGAVGEKGDKGDQGEQGTPGKSAYEIAVENGFVGTEADWLASLKGQDGEDGEDGKDLTASHTHNYGAENIILDATAYKSGLAYSACDCGQFLFVAIEHVQATEGEVTKVKNYGKTYFHTTIPESESGAYKGSLYVKVMDENGEVVPAEDYTISYFTKYYDWENEVYVEFDQVNSERVFEVSVDGSTEGQYTIEFKKPAQYANYQVEPIFAFDGVAYENTIVLNVEDGTNAGVTKIKSSYVDYVELSAQTFNIEADVVDGKATFTAPSKNYYGEPINLELELVGFDGENYVVDAEALTFTRPADGQYDKGGIYTINIKAYQNFTFTVEDNEGNAIEGATINIYQAVAANKYQFGGFDSNWNMIYVPSTEVEYATEAYATLTTDANGQATARLLTAPYETSKMVDGEKDPVTYTAEGFYYQYVVSGDFGFGYAAPAPATLSLDNKNVVATPIYSAMYMAKGETQQILLNADATGVVQNAYIETAEETVAGEYTLKFEGVQFSGYGDTSAATITMALNGVALDLTKSGDMFDGYTFKANVTLNDGINEITVGGTNGGFGTFSFVDKEEEGTETPDTPDGPVGTAVTLGATTLNDQTAYNFTATEAGTYTFTITNTTVELYTDQESAFAPNYDELVLYIYDSFSGTTTYEKDMEADEVFNFFIYITGTGYTADLTIAKEGGEENNALIVGENTVNNNVEYSFTATEAGTYNFTFSSLYAVVYASQADYDDWQDPIWDIQTNGTTYATELTADQTVTFYLDGADDGDTITIAKSEGGEEGGEGPIAPSVDIPEGATEIALGATVTVNNKVCYFTATEAGTYTFSMSVMKGSVTTCCDYNDPSNVIVNNTAGASTATGTIDLAAGQTIVFTCTGSSMTGIRIKITKA